MFTFIHYLLLSECASTQFGPNCNTSCSENCLDRICNQSTGHCLYCINSRFGLFCESDISSENQSFGE